MGVAPGECVAVVGFNRPEWVTTNIATMAIGASSVGIYATYSSQDVRAILSHCSASVAVVENADQWQKISGCREQLPKLRHVVLMSGAPEPGEFAVSWQELIGGADSIPAEQFDELVRAVKPTTPAIVAYRSCWTVA